MPAGPAIVPATPAPFVAPAPAFTPAQTGPLTALTWDAEQKEQTSKPGDINANYTFWFTNTSPAEVVINAVRTSCGCTVAKLAATPWRLPPGSNGPIEVALDLRGKSGTIAKAVTVESSAGVKSLIVKMNITGGAAPTAFTINRPRRSDADRLKDMQESLRDRQVVFKDAKCAACHDNKPALAQLDGGVIYRGLCATCHDSDSRAAAVADLKTLKHETDLNFWRYWITNGREGTMMPAYAQAHGGPLNELQINSLAAYCFNTFKPAASSAAMPAAVSSFPLPKAK